ncbi:LysM peptidoglycan-binding domain-containing protein [Tamlana fucoidanivorans]|uniref:LysM peptidoglycan-binding domain-containing protein n=1 Tax=Allotamlana fucoidanivorans TaxID=2583814 RepID=A0A5C4SLI9_9FLAO|nr:LysM peptidoglycan-binding domain-containing protein [Tamlana fucoidanivorans]TNJ44542.1 LysM peptidoglycan-binding domain-containing protein [Tamlana fucoidanivorans]
MNRLVLVLCFMMSVCSAKAQNFSTHQVKQGETIESISKRYYVTPFDIYKLNPDAKKGLKPNTILIIPISAANKPKVTVSKELQGFKEHKTKKKETLYSLAQAYNVEEEDIKKYNKFLYANPLRKGDRLQIPVFKITEVVEKVEATKQYTVKAKEGKWRIAYKFGITIEELEALNPDLEGGLKVGQIINVPNLEASEQNVVDDTYSYYKVLPKEGFYRLKLKLGLEQAELERLNPGLEESGLKSGMILKIPFSDAVSPLVEGEAKPVNLLDSLFTVTEKHLVLMLPFRANRVDFDSISDIERSIRKDPYLNASLEFYSGVLSAVDSLKKMGVSLKLDVYDTQNQVSEVSKILRGHDFDNIDAVIGPLTPNCFDKVASELKLLNVPVVSPIGTNVKLYDNVFQSRPSDDLLKRKVVNFVKTDSTSHIVIISDSNNTNVANELKREFPRASQVKSRKNKETGKDEFFVTRGDIEAALKPGKNLVFLETQKEGFASNVTSILASLIRGEDKEHQQEAIDVVLFTTKINAAFEGDQVNNTHLSKLQFHFASVAKEYNENDTNSFVTSYIKTNNISPNKRAVKGFDLTMDVVLRLLAFDDLYLSVNKAPLTEYVENKFAYKKKLFGGYYNDTVYLVKYNDLTIVEVEP